MSSSGALGRPSAVGTTQVSDSFGFSVAASGDTIVVGAYLEDSSTLGVNTAHPVRASAQRCGRGWRAGVGGGCLRHESARPSPGARAYPPDRSARSAYHDLAIGKRGPGPAGVECHPSFLASPRSASDRERNFHQHSFAHRRFSPLFPAEIHSAP